MPPAPTPEYEVNLRVTPQERVASMITALLWLVGLIVLLMFLIFITNRVSTTQHTVPVEYLDELPGGDPSMGDGRDFEEPGTEELEDLAPPELETMLSAVTDVASTSLAAAPDMTGNVAQGTGGGDRRRAGRGGNASVPRWERWEVRFNSTSLSNYAEQLQAFGIELAAVGGGVDRVDYVSQLTDPTPHRRQGVPGEEERLYMSYRSGELKQFDRQLLQKAGVSTDGRLIVQFYPPQLESTLAGLEMQKAAGRPLKDILKTVYSVRNQNGRYSFEVVEQRYR